MTWQRWKNIMKCYPFEEYRLLKWQPPFIVQPKYDGDRCRNDGGLLLSSEENVFFSVPHINEQLKAAKLDHLPLDGELYNHDLCLEGGHELIHSIVSRTVNIHPRYEEMDFIIFDVQYGNMSQLERLKFITDLTPTLNIKVAPFWICHTLDDIKRAYDSLIFQGYEGIIVRNAFTPYEVKRSTQMMKFKPKRKDSYTITGFNEEVSTHGEPKGRLGSLTLSSQAGDLFNVSAGLDDEERDYFWSIKESLIGKICIVHYQHLTEKKIPKGTFDIEIVI